jgi:hypothetical protein
MADTDDRIGRYQTLIAEAGAESPALELPSASATLYLSSPPTLAHLVNDPERLRAAIRARVGDAADIRRRRAYASVLQQNLALTIIAPLTMQLFTEGKARIPTPDQISLKPCPGDELTGEWLWHETGECVGVDDFARGVADQVKAWYPVFRQYLGVAPGAYWSSIGLGLCAPFSALYDKALPERLCDEASDWLNTIDCDARRYIDWIPATFNQQPCAIPQRRGCCLKFRLPNGDYCGTCGIYRNERMAIRATNHQPTRPSLWSPPD